MASPLELLSNKTDTESALGEVLGPVVAGTFGLVTTCLYNYGSRKPAFSGLQKHVIITLACAALGKFLMDHRKGYFAERDAVLRHYVELHPEDFPAPERKKYADLFEPWYPIR